MYFERRVPRRIPRAHRADTNTHDPYAALGTPRAAAEEAGFTLVELLIVMALLGLFATIIGPYLAVEDDVSTAARQLVRLLDELQIQSADTQLLWRVRFDLDRRMYWVTMVDAGEERQPVESARWAHPFLLPGRVRFQHISTMRDRQTTTGRAMVQVFPDKRQEPFSIYLLDEAGNFMAVTAHPLTGQIAVSAHPQEDTRLDVIDDRLRPLLFPVMR
jgi:prepilin-type N-terminal cleavage/methylation domain-containing protein